MHIIIYDGGGCQGTTFLHAELAKLMEQNGIKMCPLNKECLQKPYKRPTYARNVTDAASALRMMAERCFAAGTRGIVLNVPPYQPSQVGVDKFVASLPATSPHRVYRFGYQRENFLYKLICETLDFSPDGNTTNARSSYIVYTNGTRLDHKDFQMTRARPDNLKVYLDLDTISRRFHFYESVARYMQGKYKNDVFTMEQLFAYEYGNQLSLLSYDSWRRLAKVVNLSFTGFFKTHMKSRIGTRALRSTHSLVDNADTVIRYLQQHNYEQYVIPEVNLSVFQQKL